jgi:hypothetical protein
MALVNFLKIGADGLEAENDPATDELSVLDLTLNGTPLNAGTAGVDVISDLASAYINFTPGADTLQATLNAIDVAIGAVTTNNCMVVESFTNGEAAPITIGNAVYIDSDNTVKLADNDVSAKDDPIGLVKVASIAAAATGAIVTNGCATGVLVGATAGNKYFLDSTPGALTTTVPTASGKNVVFMGYAINATDLYLRIQNIGKRA